MAERLNRSSLATEQQNPSSMDLDSKSVAKILEIINREDSTVSEAVREVLPQLEKVVNLAVDAIRGGHHVIYVGAGTSGRLGVWMLLNVHLHFRHRLTFSRALLLGEKKL
jgi:N-acetylmuramic acid 6-phosphate etherase